MKENLSFKTVKEILFLSFINPQAYVYVYMCGYCIVIWRLLLKSEKCQVIQIFGLFKILVL